MSRLPTVFSASKSESLAMTNWSLDDEKKSGVLSIAGDMTVDRAHDLKNRMLEAFACAERVTVDIPASMAVDVAGAQLLCASHRYAVGHGKKMELRFDHKSRFAEFLNESGFTRDFVCSHGKTCKCLWMSANGPPVLPLKEMKP